MIALKNKVLFFVGIITYLILISVLWTIVFKITSISFLSSTNLLEERINTPLVPELILPNTDNIDLAREISRLTGSELNSLTGFNEQIESEYNINDNTLNIEKDLLLSDLGLNEIICSCGCEETLVGCQGGNPCAAALNQIKALELDI